MLTRRVSLHFEETVKSVRNHAADGGVGVADDEDGGGGGGEWRERPPALRQPHRNPAVDEL